MTDNTAHHAVTATRTVDDELTSAMPAGLDGHRTPDATGSVPAPASPAIDPATFRLLAETTSAGILIYREHRILYANPAVEAMLGYTLEELQAFDDAIELIAPQDRAVVSARARARMRGEAVPANYELRMCHREGEMRWMRTSVRRIEIEGAPAALATLLDVTDHRYAEHALKHQLAFEQLILGISKQFLNLAADRFDDGIHAALRALGEFTNVDRVALFLHDVDEDVFVAKQVWYAHDAIPGEPFEDRFPASRFQWGFEQLRLLEPLHIPDVHHLPPAASRERADFEAKGIRGVVSVPVAQRGEMLGFVAFDSLRQPRIWPDASLTLLKILGEILANALVRRRAADALAAERERALVTLGAIGDGVIRTDAHGRIDYLNPVAARLTGWSDADARGRSVPEVYRVLSEASRRARRDPVALCLAQRRTVTLPGLGTLLSRDGRECTVRDVVSPIVDARGRLLGTVLAFKDLTEMRGLEREMAYLASHDPLTGLLNRSEFEIHLEAALESAREEAVRHALLFIDLHQFKLVNDACGHVAGDELLRQVARLLQEVVGESGVVGRLGGDEFGVLLEKVSSSEARTVANAIQRVLRENRFDWGGQHFDIEATLGIVPITVASDSVIQILKAADAACYLARDSTNRIHETIPDDRALSKRYVEVQMVHRIRRAIEEDRFLLHAQRIEPTDPESGKMAFHEILLRMIDERGEMVSPGVFIPLAERYQLGPMLDRWVVRRVLRLLRRGRVPALQRGFISINLSGQTLSDEAFLPYVLERLESSGVDPRRLYFEVTETAAVAHLSRAIHMIRALKEIGCGFILDDFGSGLSSFGYLQNLPVDVLKIDGDFIREMDQDPIRQAMVKSIHEVGHVMGMSTVAEWIENERVLGLVRSLNITYAQGFYIHRPEPVREVDDSAVS